MRSCNNLFRGAFALGLTGALAGCGLMGGEGERPFALSANPTPGEARTGPSADYPMVLGEPFSIDGVEHVPSDALNHDEVGYASLDAEAGAGVGVAGEGGSSLACPSASEMGARAYTPAGVAGVVPDFAGAAGTGGGVPVADAEAVSTPEGTGT